MAAEEQQQESQGVEETQSSAKGTAAKAAAAAAATGVAAFAAKKAISSRGSSDGGSSNGDTGSGNKGEVGSVVSSALSGGWDAARDALIPAAEDAAGAAGEWLAENGPEVIRDRIVPRFIESCTKAHQPG